MEFVLLRRALVVAAIFWVFLEFTMGKYSYYIKLLCIRMFHWNEEVNNFWIYYFWTAKFVLSCW